MTISNFTLAIFLMNLIRIVLTNRLLKKSSSAQGSCMPLKSADTYDYTFYLPSFSEHLAKPIAESGFKYE